ncbi:MAG: Wzz/FepE/Etk N-terminal domain-containing protein [Bacteroidales bacterium]
MEENNNIFNSFSLIQFVWKWRKWITGICIAAAVLSFCFSTHWFIRPQFKSTAVIYAPRTNSIAKILMNEQNYNERLDIKAYAVEEETEQMMQILNSQDIKNAIIKKFNLIKHYSIDTNARYWKTKLDKTLTNSITIKRTEYGAISITVMDVDPVLASEMANEIANQLDTVKNRIEHERAMAAYHLLQKQLVDIDAELARVDDSIQVLMQHGVFDFESQSERVMQQYAIAVAQGNSAGVQRLEKELEKLSTYGPRARSLRDLQYGFRSYQTLCKSKMMDAKMDMDSQMPVKFIVEKAIPADKKAYPKKFVIVLISTVAAFILSILVLLTIEKIKLTPILEKKEENEA